MSSREAAARPGLLLVDDHTIVREGLRRILEAVADEWQIIEAGSGFQALECLRRQHFGMAIVDLSMPGMSGLELIKRVRAEYPHVKVLVLSMHAEDQYALRAFRAGAHGYVTKDTASAELLAAVRKVADGGAYVTASLAERVVQQLNGAQRWHRTPTCPTASWRCCNASSRARGRPRSPRCCTCR
jgi:DNA-binding NarL/FixJ family response regulator